jgi:predicted ester cyclase
MCNVGSRTGAERGACRPDESEAADALPHIGIDDLVAEGDTVVTRVSERGSHKGEWRHYYVGRIAPTHRAVSCTRIIIRRIRNGKVVESWINADHLGMLHQVGALDGLHKNKV